MERSKPKKIIKIMKKLLFNLLKITLTAYVVASIVTVLYLIITNQLFPNFGIHLIPLSNISIYSILLSPLTDQNVLI